MKPSYHYYEGHVTVEPVFGDRLEEFTRICLSEGFRVAKLLLQRHKEGTEEPNKNDAFCTGRDTDYDKLHSRVFALLRHLRKEKFKIRRFKIESTLLDSRYDESLQCYIHEEPDA